MATTHHVNYKKIYIMLLVLLAISIAGPELGVPWLTLVTAFGIAIVKTVLVVNNFMHLKWEKKIMKWVLLASLVIVALFWAAVEPDVRRHDGQNWTNDAAKAATDRGIEPPHQAEAPAAGAGTMPAGSPESRDTSKADSAKAAH